MLWYLLKTWAGKEEELVKELRRTVPPYMYHEAFVIYNERIWRRQGRSIVHTEPLFQGCAFVTCKESEPLFRQLERVPAMSKLMAMGYLSVFPLRAADADFLEQLAGEDHVVRLSHVLRTESRMVVDKNDSELLGHTDYYQVSGPLTQFLGDVENFDFKKRFAKLRRNIWGEDMVIPLGIVLNEDVEQKVRYFDLDVSVEVPERYEIMEIGKDKEGKRTYTLAGS